MPFGFWKLFELAKEKRGKERWCLEFSKYHQVAAPSLPEGHWILCTFSGGEGAGPKLTSFCLFCLLPVPEDSLIFLSEQVLVSFPHSPSLGSIVFPAPDRCGLWYPVPRGQLSPLTSGAVWGSMSIRTHPSDKEVPFVMEREEGPYLGDPSFRSFFWKPHRGGGGLVAKSCPTPCNPRDCSPPGSSVHRILQARMLEWVAISFSILALNSAA